jgi:hypothetical protein
LAAVALVVGHLSVAPTQPAAASVEQFCTTFDLSSHLDKQVRPGVVAIGMNNGNPNWEGYGVSSGGEVYPKFFGRTGRYEFLTPGLVALWETATDCLGEDESRSAWAVGPNGKVYTWDTGAYPPDARHFGDASTLPLNKPIVGMSATPTGAGYWLVASDGGIFTYGDAKFFGSTGALQLNQPIVGMNTTPTGNGYWLVAADGGIFSFGDATFYGSTGDIRLNKPIIGMVSPEFPNGYWLIASDGGVFSFGGAEFKGSLGGEVLSAPIAGMVPVPGGYTIVGGDLTTYGFW